MLAVPTQCSVGFSIKMKLFLIYLICCCFGIVRNFGHVNQMLFRKDVSNGLFSIVSKNLANKKNLTSDAIFPGSKSDMSKLPNDEIKQEMEILIETGNRLKHAENVEEDRQDILEAGKFERTSAANHTQKSNGGKMNWNVTSEPEIDDYDLYQEDENAIDHFAACAEAQCNFKGKCLATETDEVFCICNDWSFGATCQINATGVAVGFFVAIFILVLIMTAMLVVKNCLKYKKWRKNNRKMRENDDCETNEEKHELSKLEIR